jgi:uncharacterized membrane protein YjgN (DUF898 family)
MATTERMVRPEFSATAAEYFRIWIVNLFFTLITLGIYSAWAKVRKKRYFYGSTRFDGDSFDYFGNPKAILRGRVIAVLVFVAYAILGELYPESRFVFWASAALLFPFFLVRAFAFNARNSAFRGLRFDFTATTRQAMRMYIGMALLVLVTFGIAYPWLVARHKNFVLSHHSVGTTGFDCNVTGRQLWNIYFRAGLIVVAVSVPTGLLGGMAMSSLRLPEWLEWARYLFVGLPIYAAYAAAYAYTQARTTNLLWNGTSAPGIRFSSTLAPMALIKVYLGNALAAACSAGLLIPWAIVRTMRYRLENFAAIVEGSTVFEANPNLARVGATGQELGDIFSLDLGV